MILSISLFIYVFSVGIMSSTANRLTMALSNKACFGAGCYWGTEKFFKVDFGQKLKPGSIKDGKVGFMSALPNAKKNPTYREVCTGATGHVEVYDLVFDGDESTYEQLVKHFFMFHDPTTKDRQGNDVGTQYASAIFCFDDKQMEIAKRVTAELQQLQDKGKITGYKEKKVSTSITPAFEFYPAQEDHQQYLEKNPWGYCNHGYRFTKWPSL